MIGSPLKPQKLNIRRWAWRVFPTCNICESENINTHESNK